ncbi:hypothetical protein PFZ55_31340 [Streptomyces sp. MS2A]|nr:hypothetical protein [Streptomyces sp. MS2A]
MIEKNPHRPLQGKKRYIAIATLASLVATGGLVGATVTAQSTIANNQITVAKAPTAAAVTASGAPVDVSFEEGEDITGVLGITQTGWSTAQATITLTNTGDTNAAVKVAKIPDLVLPHSPFASANTSLSLMVTHSGSTVFAQSIAGRDLGNVAVNDAVKVPAGGSVELKVAFYFFSGAPGESTKFDVATSKTFDLAFDYGNEGDSVAAGSHTPESTIAGNSIVITEAPKSDAKVEVSGTPMSLSFTEGDEVGANTSTARQEYVLTNTGETDATVRLQSVDDLVIPTKPGLGSQDVAGVLRAYTGSALEPGMVNAVFSQKVAGANAAPGTSLPFTVPAGESVTISVDFSFAKGTTIFTDYNKTFDLKFDYINKQ